MASSTLKTQPAARSKPAKPYPDFPLFAHARGYWAKKIRGKLYYFGRWDDPDAALTKFVTQRDDLYAGRLPREENLDAVTLRDLCNTFLSAKQHEVETAELSQRHFDDLHRTCKRLIKRFGKHRLVEDLRVDEFAELRASLAAKWAPTTLGPEVARIRSIFRFGYNTGVLESEVRSISALQPPSKRALRAHRQSLPKKLYNAAEVSGLIEAAENPQMKAFIHLGLNCGFGNRDCSSSPQSAFDLEHGQVTFARTKTAIDRRCPLWPETVEALRVAFEHRASITPGKASSRELAFLTDGGHPWGGDHPSSAVTQLFAKVAKKAGCYRKGVGFYALRHTFATVAGGARDDVAMRYIMGHVDNSISATYREEIADERLEQVIAFVREWFLAREGAT